MQGSRAHLIVGRRCLLAPILGLALLLLSCAPKPHGATHVHVGVDSSPTVAAIYLDGHYVGNTPLMLDIWYDRFHGARELVALNLYPNQYPQQIRIAVPKIPQRIHFFMDNPSDVKFVAPKPAAPSPRPQPKATPMPLAPVTMVFFPFDSDAISPLTAEAIRANAIWLQQHPTYAFLLVGYGDERGSAQYNLELGRKRAEAVRKRLLALGVAADRVRVISRGEMDPVRLERNEQAWQQNRRVEFLVLRWHAGGKKP